MRLLSAILALMLCCAAPAFAEEEKEDVPAALDPVYVQIAPFVIPVIGTNGPEEVVSLIITLEVNTPDKASYIRARLPKLNDAYMQTLYGALDRDTIKKNGLIDVSLLKGKLSEATDKVLGTGYVNDVLVQALSQRRL